MVSQTKNEKDSAIIFYSKIGLEILSKAKRWHSDGTFETTPAFFYQFYILYGWYMFPCAFILLTGKNQEIYKLAIQELINNSLANRFSLRPEEILTDFERAIINVYDYFFPHARIYGCWFHFGQCLYMKLCEIGLKNQYSTDSQLKIWFKSIIALALVPLDKVLEGFEYLIDNQPSILFLILV